MKTCLFFSSLIMIAVLACSKDKFTTEPQVKVKSIAPNPVNFGNIIKVNASFTDDEGNLDSVLIVYKYYNGITPTRIDTFRYTVGELNIPVKTRQADILIQFAYGKNIEGYKTLGSSAKDTTASFGLLLVDATKKRSNYSESDKVRLKKP